MTRVVEQLEAMGLIERRADADDRRRSVAAVTEAGRALLAEGRARKDAMLARRIAELDADQLHRLAAALDVLDILAGTRTTMSSRLRASPPTRSARSTCATSACSSPAS